MAFVFYDTETTGTDTYFDQIVQFGAIRTDDKFREVERFEVRSRLQPHIVPSPAALSVTGLAPEDLIDRSRPSHFDAVRQIHATLLRWSPSAFLGFNSIAFDEVLLRQAFYQSLLPIYVTNTRGNRRGDVMRMAHAFNIVHPELLKIPRTEAGVPTFRLERLARQNGFKLDQAHEALSDAEATIHLCRIMRSFDRDLWEAMMALAVRRKALEVLEANEMLVLGIVSGGETAWRPVAPLGPNPRNANEFAVFDLCFEPQEFFARATTGLVRELDVRSGAVRVILLNRQPIILDCATLAQGMENCEVSRSELRRRARLVATREDFKESICGALGARNLERRGSGHVERRIYEKFVEAKEMQTLTAFHGSDWKDKVAVATSLTDTRLRELARRLIYFEDPGLLSDQARRELDRWLSKRLLAVEEDVPWRTVGKALKELDELAGGEQISQSLEQQCRSFLEEVERSTRARQEQ